MRSSHATLDRLRTEHGLRLVDPGLPVSAATVWAIAGLLVVSSLAVWYAIPVWFAPLLLIFGVSGALVSIAYPFLTCLSFVVLSFFRVHEAYVFLFPLHLPLASGLLMAVSLIWHLCFSRSIRPIWSIEIKAFTIFFVLVTFGVAFAVNRPLAWSYWSDVFWKIGVTTLALAWLPTRPVEFRNAAVVFITAGAALALVAIHNHWAGVDLVEGTRVSIGREIKSILGDPNDLALVLLFPMSFAGAIIAFDRSKMIRVMGFLALSLIVYAIVLTQSRGGLIGILAVASVFGMRFVRSKVLLMTTGAIGAMSLYGAMGIAERVIGSSVETGIDESTMDRFQTWSTALNMVMRRPLTGVGIDNFADSYYFFTDYFHGQSLVAHSTWLGVLAEAGVPAFLVFVTMVAFSWRSIARASRIARQLDLGRDIDAAAIGIFAGLVGFCASGTFLSQGFSWPIYILVALSVGLSRMVDRLAATIATSKQASECAAPGDAQ